MAQEAAIPLPYLMAGLHRVRFNGRMGLLEGDVERSVLFNNGQPVHVQSRLQEETLGRILLDEGTISLDQYNQMLETMVANRKPAGEVLISLGVLGPQGVFSALEFQTRKKLINCFRMADFHYAVLEEQVPPELLIAELDVAEAILSGILTCYSVDRLLDEFPVDEETVFIRRSLSTEQPLKIGSKENRILRSLGTGTSLAKLMAGGTDLQYLLSVLYTFYSMKLSEAAGVNRPTCAELTDLETRRAAAKQTTYTRVNPVPESTPVAPPSAKPAQKPTPPQPPPPVEAEAVEVDLSGIEQEEDFRPPTLASIMEGLVDPKLAEKVLAMGREDHFTFLGVDRTADEIRIKSAYNRLLHTFKLEKIDDSYLSIKERDLASRLLNRAMVSFRILSDSKTCKDYLKALKKNKKPSPETMETPPRILADVEAQKGLLAMRNKRWEEAEKLFNHAIRLYPKEPSYHFQLGKLGYTRALEETPAGEMLDEGLRKPLLKALALNPRYDEPRLYLGYLAKRNGNFKLAHREFKGALECNPQNRVALSELRLLKRRMRERDEASHG